MSRQDEEAQALREACAVLGWSQRDLARRLDTDDRTVRRWFAAAERTPAAVIVWVEAHAAYYQRVPPPALL